MNLITKIKLKIQNSKNKLMTIALISCLMILISGSKVTAATLGNTSLTEIYNLVLFELYTYWYIPALLILLIVGIYFWGQFMHKR